MNFLINTATASTLLIKKLCSKTGNSYKMFSLQQTEITFNNHFTARSNNPSGMNEQTDPQLKTNPHLPQAKHSLKMQLSRERTPNSYRRYL